MLEAFRVRVLPKGTAFVTDVGMTGPVNSVIRSDGAAVVERFFTGISRCLAVADGASIMNAVLIDVSDDGRSTSIERVDREVVEMEVKVDLHLHTTVSDGRLTPSELVKYTAAQGLEVIAVSDHDITDGLDEAYATAQEYPNMTIIPAIELSTHVPDDEVHMLGYFIDYEDREFQNILDKFREGRLDRGQLMVNKLAEYGMNIEWGRVLEIAGEGSVGRPHVALALVEKGYFKEPKDAFEEYLCNGGLAYIGRKNMTPVQGVEMLSKVGGAAVIAHPASIVGLDEMLGELKKAGLAGIEVFYAKYSAETISWLYEMSVKHDLVPCGGSDYHGLGNTGEQVPGSMGPPMESVERLKAISDDIRKGPTRSSIPTS